MYRKYILSLFESSLGARLYGKFLSLVSKICLLHWKFIHSLTTLAFKVEFISWLICEIFTPFPGFRLVTSFCYMLQNFFYLKMTIVCNCVYCIVFYLLKTTSIKTSFRVGSVLLSSATCGGHRHFLFQASVQNLLLSSERYYINYFVDIHKNWTVFISWSCWLFFKIIRSTGIKVLRESY